MASPGMVLVLIQCKRGAGQQARGGVGPGVRLSIPHSLSSAFGALRLKGWQTRLQAKGRPVTASTVRTVSGPSGTCLTIGVWPYLGIAGMSAMRCSTLTSLRRS